MAKGQIKNITIAIVLIWLSGSQVVQADGQTGSQTSSATANVPTPAQIALNGAPAATTTTTTTTNAAAPVAPPPAASSTTTTTTTQAPANVAPQAAVPPESSTTQTTQTTETSTESNLQTLNNFGQVLPASAAPNTNDRQQYMRQPSMSASGASPVIESKPLTYSQSQAMMLRSAPSVSLPPDPDADIAFNALMQQNLPLTPQQVVRLRQLIDVSQRAAAIPANVPPKPVSTTLMINLAPGTTPPAIRLAQGYVTSLVFVDSTGAPWPIAAYDIGDPKTANIQWDGKGNVMLIQAMSPYGDSDLVIRMVGLVTPITLELVSGQRVVDYRTDIHVAGIGPNTKELPTGTPLPSSANQILLSVLDGIAPSGSKLLSVKGGDCQAWLVGDTMYLRTRLTVLSPGWVGRMVSPDGMYAYEIQKTSSVLVSQYGEPIELKVEGF
jgi:intracellular multiplication protein IcmK